MEKKTVLITGASKGIGMATARLFATHRWNVVLHYHQDKKSAEKLQEELQAMGIETLLVSGDIAEETAVKEIFLTAKKAFGKLDAVVNNAGTAQQKLFTDFTVAEVEAMLNVNLKGAIFCCQHAVRIMLQEHSGAIVNLSSIYGISGGACEVPYSAAKAGIIGLTKALAKEVSLSGIRVNCVAPGAIDTPMNAHLDAETVELLQEEIPMGRMGRAEEVAETIYFLCSDSASYITGQVISPNGGAVI